LREPPADDLFGRPVGIHVRRVDEVAAAFDEAVELFMGDFLRAFGAEGHRPQAER
jgi:hypothetical protein